MHVIYVRNRKEMGKVWRTLPLEPSCKNRRRHVDFKDTLTFTRDSLVLLRYKKQCITCFDNTGNWGPSLLKAYIESKKGTKKNTERVVPGEGGGGAVRTDHLKKTSGKRQSYKLTRERSFYLSFYGKGARRSQNIRERVATQCKNRDIKF